LACAERNSSTRLVLCAERLSAMTWHAAVFCVDEKTAIQALDRKADAQ